MPKPAIVFLPATDPADESFGQAPAALPGFEAHHVTFGRLVWYTHAIRAQTIGQFEAMPGAPFVLVGFSKSAMGAWHLTRMRPDLFRATVLFDMPAHRPLPDYVDRDAYPDETAWHADLPMTYLEAWHSEVPADHRLVLVTGENFGDEMRDLSAALDRIGREHTLLDRPTMKHHWASGWLDEALPLVV